MTVASLWNSSWSGIENTLNFEDMTTQLLLFGLCSMWQFGSNTRYLQGNERFADGWSSIAGGMWVLNDDVSILAYSPVKLHSEVLGHPIVVNISLDLYSLFNRLALINRLSRSFLLFLFDTGRVEVKQCQCNSHIHADFNSSWSHLHFFRFDFSSPNFTCSIPCFDRLC